MTVDTFIIICIMIIKVNLSYYIARPGRMKIVATTAVLSCVNNFGLRVIGSVNVQIARAVANLAPNDIVKAFLRQIHNILVAIGTGLLVYIFYRVGFDFCKGVTPVMAVLSKRLRRQVVFQYEKKQGENDENEEDSL